MSIGIGSTWNDEDLDDTSMWSHINEDLEDYFNNCPTDIAVRGFAEPRRKYKVRSKPTRKEQDEPFSEKYGILGWTPLGPIYKQNK